MDLGEVVGDFCFFNGWVWAKLSGIFAFLTDGLMVGGLRLSIRFNLSVIWVIFTPI
jgi:hypothetical protein